jgi:hypothetical protein
MWCYSGLVYFKDGSSKLPETSIIIYQSRGRLLGYDPEDVDAFTDSVAIRSFVA